MNWNDTSELARDVMKELGSFGPTLKAPNCEVKGYTSDGDGSMARTYWTSDDLRRIAQGCTEVADWLDARAQANRPTAGKGE